MIVKSRQRIKYILSDFLACNCAWCIFNIIRYYTLPYNHGNMSLVAYFSMTMVIIGQLVFPAMMVCLYALSGFYNNVYSKSRIDQVVNSFGISLIGSIIIFFIALFDDSIYDRLQNYEMVAMLWILIAVSVTIPRIIISSKIMRRIEKREIKFNTIIVGTSAEAVKLSNQLQHKYPRMGLNVVAYASIDNTTTDSEINGIPVKQLDDLLNKLDTLNISSFVVVSTSDSTAFNISLINKLFPTGRSIYVTPDIMHMVTARPRTQMVSGELLLDVSRSPIPASTLNIKRLSDIIVSALALVILAPLYAIIAIMVKTSSKGPIIYSQERVGLRKKVFNIYKFRTMYVGSEANGPSLSSANDTRITNVGHVLRKYRLDELPQFWNVLKGDMSIVGPRPEREFYLRQIIEKAPYLGLVHQVRPGITSWGMVKYGYASSVDEMIERGKYDLLYVDNVSLIVDLKILFYTIETVVTGKGV